MRCATPSPRGLTRGLRAWTMPADEAGEAVMRQMLPVCAPRTPVRPGGGSLGHPDPNRAIMALVATASAVHSSSPGPRRAPSPAMGRSPGPTWSRSAPSCGSPASSCSSRGSSRCTSRSARCSPELWTEKTAQLNVPVRDGQHHDPRDLLGLVPARRLRGRARPARAHRLAAADQQWGMREWYVLTYIFGAIFVVRSGPASTPTWSQEGITISSDAYGSVFYLTTGFHGLHVTGGLHRLPADHRPHLHHPAVTRHAQATGAIVDLLLLALRRRRLDRPVRHDLPAASDPATDDAT